MERYFGLYTCLYTGHVRRVFSAAWGVALSKVKAESGKVKAAVKRAKAKLA